MQELPEPSGAPFSDDVIDAISSPEAATDVSAAELEVAKRWKPENMREADWVSSKFAKRSAELNEIEELARERIAQIEAWRTAERTRINRTLNWAVGILSEFAAMKRETEGLKTLNLPDVKVTSRTAKAAIKVTDASNEALIAWARERAPEAIKTTSVVQVAEVKKVEDLALEESGAVVDKKTGVVIEGLTVEPAKVTYTVAVR